MATYSAVTAGEKDADSPINVSLIDKLDQNPLAIAEGASGAPKIQTAAIQDDAVTNDKLEKAYYSGDWSADVVTKNLPAGWNVTKPAAGRYTLTHNLGTSDYTIIAMAEGNASIVGSQVYCTYRSKSTNTVDIYAQKSIYTVPDETGGGNEIIYLDASINIIIVMN